MKKKFPQKYFSEDEVKKALGIESFRNLSKDKVMEFASLIPYIDRDVAMKIIDQFPAFVDFAKNVVECYAGMCNDIVNSNKEAMNAAIQGYQTILDALSEKLNKETLTENDRKAITDDMFLAAEGISKIYLQNQKFLNKIVIGAVTGLVAILSVVATAIGVNSRFGSNTDELPRIENNTDNFEDEEEAED